MKIIGFSSGAVGRESNVDRMVKALLDKCEEPSEFVKLTDLTFSGCKGCVHLCAGPQVCMLEDDLLPYYQKVKEADAVVLGSSIYFGTINATMVSFIERFFGFRHVKNTIKGKPFVLVTSGGGDNSDTVEDHFRKVLRPSEIEILQMIHYKSGIPPCYSCGRHQECSLGGLYRAAGKAAHQMNITHEHFRRWENYPKVCKEMESALEKLNQIKIKDQ